MFFVKFGLFFDLLQINCQKLLIFALFGFNSNSLKLWKILCVVRIESWYKFMSEVYKLNLVEIHGARLNSSEKFKKTQGFPFFGPSPGREGNDFKEGEGEEENNS